MDRSKLFLIVLTLILILIFPVSAMAVDLTMISQDAAPGDQIVIPIYVNGFTGVAGIQLYLTYDDNFLSGKILIIR